MERIRAAIIGGGAAGCFAAVNLKRMAPEADVTVFEAGDRILAKVAITGGGRCNLTNSFRDIANLADAYPRGASLMKRLFKRFGHNETCQWFESMGVRLVVQEDQCVFPASQDAMEIVNALAMAMRESGVKVRTKARVTSLVQSPAGWKISAGNTEDTFDRVLVTTGGCTGTGWQALFSGLDLEIASPVPSLFSVKIDDPALKELMGTVVEDASVSIPRTKFRGRGPLLVTDWGMSGPAILKLSSAAARFLSENGYQSTIIVNWFGEMSAEEITGLLKNIASSNPKKLISNAFPEIFNARLWRYFLLKMNISPETRWAETGAKTINRIAERLHADEFRVVGRNRFKSEFVTCGGVSLKEINPETMESRKYPGLFFAGEVTDVDAITGGFNLQAAWSMGYAAAAGMTAEAGPKACHIERST
ncbi:MAG: NAD(P)/FAD-dependent oxidoreductase [Candidatus Cryptobacteroides sp.]